MQRADVAQEAFRPRLCGVHMEGWTTLHANCKPAESQVARSAQSLWLLKSCTTRGWDAGISVSRWFKPRPWSGLGRGRHSVQGDASWKKDVPARSHLMPGPSALGRPTSSPAAGLCPSFLTGSDILSKTCDAETLCGPSYGVPPSSVLAQQEFARTQRSFRVCQSKPCSRERMYSLGGPWAISIPWDK